jgi:hypothetical protein
MRELKFIFSDLQNFKLGSVGLENLTGDDWRKRWMTIILHFSIMGHASERDPKLHGNRRWMLNSFGFPFTAIAEETSRTHGTMHKLTNVSETPGMA